MHNQFSLNCSSLGLGYGRILPRLNAWWRADEPRTDQLPLFATAGSSKHHKILTIWPSWPDCQEPNQWDSEVHFSLNIIHTQLLLASLRKRPAVAGKWWREQSCKAMNRPKFYQSLCLGLGSGEQFSSCPHDWTALFRIRCAHLTQRDGLEEVHYI